MSTVIRPPTLRPPRRQRAPVRGPRLADLVRVGHDGVIWIRNDAGETVRARVLAGLTVVQLRQAWHADRPVLVLDEADMVSPPVVIGVVADHARPLGAVTVVAGRRVELEGDDEIILRCGRASITLTRAGRIIIDGDQVASRSAGVQRIQGGSVRIN